MSAEKKSYLHWWIIGGMILGALVGTWVHSTAYQESLELARKQVLGEDYTSKPEEDQDKLLIQNAKAIDRALLADLKEKSFAYQAFEGLSTIFLKLLKMIVIPLVFFSLVSGMLGLGDLRHLGRIGAKTFGLYMLTSLLALVTGLALVNIIQPGAGITIPIPDEAIEKVEVPSSFWDVIVAMIPSNVIAAAASFELIGVIIFTLFFGIFLLAVDNDKRQVMVAFIEGGAEVMMKMTHFIIRLAPIGIAALIASMVTKTGPGVFLDLIAYVLTVLAALACHVFISLPLLILLFTRRNPYGYLRTMSTALLTGFSTASSSGTLAVTMDRAENGYGVHKRITSFVLPLGATINMDGTALYEIVSVLFIAQVHSAVDPAFQLTFTQQILIVFLGLMVSIGAAGIPHAGLVMMVIILEAVGLPVAYTGVIWSVDRVLDMCRTATNIASDSSVTLIVAHGEKAVGSPGAEEPAAAGAASG